MSFCLFFSAPSCLPPSTYRLCASVQLSFLTCRWCCMPSAHFVPPPCWLSAWLLAAPTACPCLQWLTCICLPGASRAMLRCVHACTTIMLMTYLSCLLTIFSYMRFFQHNFYFMSSCLVLSFIQPYHLLPTDTCDFFFVHYSFPHRFFSLPY